MSASTVTIDIEEVPSGDIRLKTEVILAKSINRPRPVLLMRTPYPRAEAMAFANVIELARQGWAVVVQSVRGRYGSQGTFTPFVQERVDGFNTVKWCAQQPWSTGAVAMTGASYIGYTQWAAASARPAGLRAISPIVSSAIPQDWFFEGGALRYAFVQSWAQGLLYTAPDIDEATRRQAVNLAADLRHMFMVPPSRSPLMDCSPFYRKWIDSANARYWDQTVAFGKQHRLTIPAFHIAGWYDIFCESSIRDFQHARANAREDGSSNQRLIIGPWSHLTLFQPQVGDLDFGLESNGLGHDVFGQMLDWLRQAVEGCPVPTGVKVFVMGANRWLELNDWPPPASSQRLYLQKDLQLSTCPEPDLNALSFLYDPARPTPSVGGRTLDLTLIGHGPKDLFRILGRSDVLLFSTQSLQQPVTIVGIVKAQVNFVTEGESADVRAGLVDIYPDGRAFQIVDSTVRAAFEPGKPRQVELTLGSVAAQLAEGHRLALLVASADFPRLDLNPSTSTFPTDASGYHAAVQTVLCGGVVPSFVEIPVLDKEVIQGASPVCVIA